MKAISLKRLEDKRYDDRFRQSRLIGLKSNRNKSNLQKNIVSYLKQKGLAITEDYRVQSDIFNKKNFLIDFKHKNCLVEINGSYWHKDILTNYTSFSDYVKEIIKAKYVIEKTGMSYFIVWEYDIKNGFNLDDIIEKLNHINETSGMFYSSRIFDEMLYKEDRLKDLIK